MNGRRAWMLVFSSVEITYSSCRSGRPCQRRSLQFQDSPGLDLKVRIARKDPAAVLPRPNGIFVQPAPDRTVADARHRVPERSACRAASATLSREQRQAKVGRQLAGKRLDLNREL